MGLSPDEVDAFVANNEKKNLEKCMKWNMNYMHFRLGLCCFVIDMK